MLQVNVIFILTSVICLTLKASGLTRITSDSRTSAPQINEGFCCPEICNNLLVKACKTNTVLLILCNNLLVKACNNKHGTVKICNNLLVKACNNKHGTVKICNNLLVKACNNKHGTVNTLQQSLSEGLQQQTLLKSATTSW